MPTIVATAKPTKNKLGKSSALPIIKNSIETKNGFRENAKTPVVISFPRLFEFNPKRKESRKFISVAINNPMETRIRIVPNILIE